MELNIIDLLNEAISEETTEETEIVVFSDLIGKTFNSVTVLKYDKVIDHKTVNLEENTNLVNKFVLENDEFRFTLEHSQDCCEEVSIESVVGDIEDLLNSPILEAESVSRERDVWFGDERYTFYKFSTLKGSVVLRWLGMSNGCYGIEVDDTFERK